MMKNRDKRRDGETEGQGRVRGGTRVHRSSFPVRCFWLALLNPVRLLFGYKLVSRCKVQA